MAITISGAQSSISDDFLHLASEIVRNQNSSEGALRSAISRAYYALFLTVRDHLFGPDEIGLTRALKQELQRKFKKKRKWVRGSHELVILALRDMESTKRLLPLTLSDQISQLKEARVHADYHFTLENLKDIPKETWREYARENIALASQLLAVARRLPSYR